MKLFTALFTVAIATAGIASEVHAQPGPPPDYDDFGLGLEADIDVDLRVDAGAVTAPGPRVGRDRHQQRRRLMAMLRRRFDRDHDGRLDRRERRAAIRFLRHRARQMARHRDARREGPPGSYPR